ncbi:hypothetical protein IF2G_09234 [Cordyceps javanica]|nr:hypothetical protein IF2G_09234 [Cordyceps javanica]
MISQNLVIDSLLLGNGATLEHVPDKGREAKTEKKKKKISIVSVSCCQAGPGCGHGSAGLHRAVYVKQAFRPRLARLTQEHASCKRTELVRLARTPGRVLELGNLAAVAAASDMATWVGGFGDP